MLHFKTRKSKITACVCVCSVLILACVSFIVANGMRHRNTTSQITSVSTSSYENKISSQNIQLFYAQDNVSSTSDISSTPNSSSSISHNSDVANQDNGTSTSSIPSATDGSSSASYNSDVSNAEIEFITYTAHVTSSQIESITAGTTYREIIASLPESANFGFYGMRQYIVDDNKLLVLRFDSLDDVCNYSGSDLLGTAKSYKYPNGELPETADEESTIVYGIVTNDYFISCIDSQESECYSLLTRNAEITFSNGSAASEEDIQQMDGLLVTFDYAYETFPPQAHCTKIVIVN